MCSRSVERYHGRRVLGPWHESADTFAFDRLPRLTSSIQWCCGANIIENFKLILFWDRRGRCCEGTTTAFFKRRPRIPTLVSSFFHFAVRGSRPWKTPFDRSHPDALCTRFKYRLWQLPGSAPRFSPKWVLHRFTSNWPSVEALVIRLCWRRFLDFCIQIKFKLRNGCRKYPKRERNEN